jgi:type III restriction enzyme
MSVDHLRDMRLSTVVMRLTQHLLMQKFRDPGGEPKLHLFGQLKRIAKQWLDQCLECKGGTYPAQLVDSPLTDLACEKINHSILHRFLGERPIEALLDPYNPTGSTAHVRFNTSKELRWRTRADRSHVDWVILDSDWEGEFCRVVEGHPQVRAYVKNQGLGFEVPYRFAGEPRRYLPDFLVLVDDGHGPADLLRLVVEIKGFKREDAKQKKATMETFWVPGVNRLGTYGRWAFAEFDAIYEIESGFAQKVAQQFDAMMARGKA